MALITCKECKQQISSEATACPHCGAKPEKGIGLFRVLVIGLVGFVAYECSSVSDRLDRQEAAKTPEQKAVDTQKRRMENMFSEALAICQVDIQRRLHDIDSAKFDTIGAREVFTMPNLYRVEIPFRAKNGFNATRMATAICQFTVTDFKPLLQVAMIK